MNKQLVILGCAKRNYDYINDEDDVWQLAAGLNINKLVKRSLVFEIHKEHEELNYIYENMISNKNNYIVHPTVNDKYKNKIENMDIYPFEDIMKKYGNYVASSFVWMLMYAVDKGYEKIIFDGIDYMTYPLDSFREIMLERSNIEYWIGYFRGKGIEINTSRCSGIFKNYAIYGYERIDPIRQPIKDKIQQIENNCTPRTLEIMKEYLILNYEYGRI